jgi:hypothetical protein
MERLPKIKNPQNPNLPLVPDVEKLEKETIGNVIINCLSYYKCKDRKEGFYVNLVAQSVIAKGNAIELKDKLKEFLIDILDQSIMREKITKDEKGIERKETIGLYVGWIIAQVLDELGVKEV